MSITERRVLGPRAGQPGRPDLQRQWSWELKPGVVIPQRTMAEQLVDFAKPLFRKRRADSLEQFRDQMELTVTVWNACVMAMPGWDHGEFLAQLRNAFLRPGANADLRDSFEQLCLRRWNPKFASDPRAVGRWEVLDTTGTGFQFQCDERVPEALRVNG